MMDEIKARLDALPNPECKWKITGDFIMDVRDRIIAKSADPRIREFLTNAPEDTARLLAEVGRLEAEAAALREALEAVEWVYHTGAGYCHWCQRTFKNGHAPDCQRQLALAADAGREALERLRRAERERDLAQEGGVMPKRIQRKRTKGWRMPPGAVFVGRPSRWGNPYIVIELSEDEREGDGRAWCVLSPEGSQVSHEFSSKSDAAQCAVEWFQEAVVDSVLSYEPNFFEPLRGKDLCCWCPLSEPCHADVLLELANG